LLDVSGTDSKSEHRTACQHRAQRGAPEIDYIVASSSISPWPNASYETVEKLLADQEVYG